MNGFLQSPVARTCFCIEHLHALQLSQLFVCLLAMQFDQHWPENIPTSVSGSCSVNSCRLAVWASDPYSREICPSDPPQWTPLPRDPLPLEPSELSEAYSANQCAFQQKGKHTFSLNFLDKSHFRFMDIHWSHDQRDQREGKLKRENLLIAVENHFMSFWNCSQYLMLRQKTGPVTLTWTSIPAISNARNVLCQELFNDASFACSRLDLISVGNGSNLD